MIIKRYALLPSLERGLAGLTPINSDNSSLAWDLDEVDCPTLGDDYLQKIVHWITQYV